MIDRKLMVFIILLFIVTLTSTSTGQGGWRQWEIHFLDGTVIEASPLQIRANGRFTQSMNPKEDGFDRSKIDYIAAVVRNPNVAFPPAPTGKFKQDLVVMLDEKQSFGKVTFKTLKFSEGTIVQNGREMSLRDVAYIKFGQPQPRVRPKTSGQRVRK